MPKAHKEAQQVQRVVKGKAFLQRVVDDDGVEDFVRREPGTTVTVDIDTAASMPDRLVLKEQVAAEDAVAEAAAEAEAAAQAAKDAANKGK